MTSPEGLERQGPIDPEGTIPTHSGRPVWMRGRLLGAVAAGGLIGAPARYELAQAVHSPPSAFPWSTLCINVTGSFVLGALLTVIVERWPPTEYVRPFAATGVLGAYTTWSTFMVDTDLLLKAGRLQTAGLYLVASLAAGLVAVYAGMALVRLWPRPKLRSLYGPFRFRARRRG